jgi:hypothetical protein
MTYQVISFHDGVGNHIADIFTLFRERRIKIGKNYPYFLVDTKYKRFLRREGKTSRGKRYYWNGAGSD